MRKTANISLTEAHAAFVEGLITTGRYANVSEIARAGLRLLQRHEAFSEAELKKMEQAWDDGIASGPEEPLEPIEIRRAAYKHQLEAAK
ncbi:MAG: type II toxin-antitoxin system ParD family antitoxin [Parvularculaceae bacterium]